MTWAFLLFKIAAPITTFGLVAGGTCAAAYFYYQNSLKYAADPNNFTSNLFIARANLSATSTEDLSKDLSCKIDEHSTVACNIYKFNTKRTTNNIEAFKFDTLAKVTAPNSDLTLGTYVVVELLDGAKKFGDLKNKSIDIHKSGVQEKILSLDFDQMLKAISALTNDTSLEPIPPKFKTFLVETISVTEAAQNSVEANKYRCKYKVESKTNQITNIDDSCKLYNIPNPTSDNKITTLEEVINAKTLATKTDLPNPSTDKFFKLEFDQNKLYNLNFESATTEAQLTVEIISNEAAANPIKVASFALKQKLVGGVFVGKTNLVLTKVTVAKTDAEGKVTGTKCNYNGDVVTGQFDCSLFSMTSDDDDIKKLSAQNPAATSNTDFSVDKYFLIRLTTAKDIFELTKGKKIYYQMTKTGDDNKHESVELEIVQLLSGESGIDKTPILISKY